MLLLDTVGAKMGLGQVETLALRKAKKDFSPPLVLGSALLLPSLACGGKFYFIMSISYLRIDDFSSLCDLYL